MKKFQGFPQRPNLQGYTAIPNMFFEEILPRINNMSELKILLAIFRKTYGWVKEIDQKTGQPIYKLEDSISYTQFEKLTGLSSTSVATGINRAIKDGFIKKTQQGNHTGTVSTYKIVTEDDYTEEISNEFHPTYLEIGSLDDVNTEGKPIGTPLFEVLEGETKDSNPLQLTNEKKEILDDIFGKSPKEEPEKEKKPSPHQQFISHWLSCYLSKFNVKYGNISGKEHGQIKNLLKEFDLDDIKRAVTFYFENYDKISGVPKGYPTISIFYGWRKTIIPASIHGLVEKKERNQREFDETKWESGGDFFDN